jgi:RNA polymerase sigma factor (sigma-70 family)
MMTVQAGRPGVLTPAEERALRRDLAAWSRRFLGLTADEFDDVYQGAWRKLREVEVRGQQTRNLNHALRWNMRNCWLEECRRRRRHPTAVLDDCSDALLARHVAPDVAEEAERLEVARDLLVAVGAMTERRRQVLLLRDVWGLSRDEVCEAVGISRRTYKDEHAAALHHLFDRLSATLGSSEVLGSPSTLDVWAA